ncbi:MAG: cellulose binding domain-containing protein [Butyrivibrio sp.]|nr:cellulose binding domain-containing protein [Muribaculum sp.]MCM1551308.1 cellulose binding domain-containing protein [Butyrivibrio sp.]
MRNNLKRKVQKAICLLMTAILLGNSIPLSNVMAQTSNIEESGWDGVTREKVWQEEGCRITYSLTDYWADGYTAMVTVENISETVIENWHVSFSTMQQVTNLWNAQIVESSNGNTVFKNLVWNQDIAAGQSVSFGFNGMGAFNGFPEICDLPAVLQPVPDGDYETVYEVTNAWDTGFNGSLCVFNISDRTIEDWQISFDLPHEINDLWGGQVVSHEGDHYVVKNSSYNQNIAAGGSVTIGFTVNSGDAENVPERVVLEEIALAKGNEQGDGTADGGDVSASDINLTIDTSAFAMNEAGGFYLTQECVENLSGTVSNIDNVEKLSYTITDINDLLVHSGEIVPQENWRTQEIGLVVGFNMITVTATHGQNETKESVILMNFNEENMDRANVDRSDTDGDGIDNYIESVLGTDPLLADTDGDGLSDLEELTQTATDPTNKDTNGDGILDGDEDYDKDGLCNLAEVQAGTKPLLADTDGDGLNDGEEVLEYFTDPLTTDTDNDGLSDGEDVKLLFDPLNPDTDGNGVLDGDETTHQTYVKELSQDKTSGITGVSVSMDCVGFIENEVMILDVYNLDMRSTDVVGLVGAPVSIETEETFDEATITFSYDEAALGEIMEDNLRIMWYDEENDKYILLDDETVIDRENNTLSYTTNHFSTWMVVDKTIWFDAMRQDINYRTGGDILCYDMAMAVDVSLSMKENNRFPLAKAALNSLVDGMLDGDRAGLIRYNDTATVVRELTGSKEDLKSGIESLSLRYGNNADNGIRAGINMLDKTNGDNRRMIVLICDGDVKYNASLVKQANDNDITIHCINVVDGDVKAMKSIAENTGGGYYYAATSADIMKAMAELNRDTLGEIDTMDSDGDGLYDVYETNGMRLSNGQVIYTDPNNPDTDGDGITDFDEVGGLPEQVTYTVDGKEYTSVLFLGSVNDKLSPEFIYVDGRVNADGTVNNEKMDYVPYSNELKKLWYMDEKKATFDKTERTCDGLDNLHGLFADKKSDAGLGWNVKYYIENIVVVIATLFVGSNSRHCFNDYIKGEGGSEPGIGGEGTRKYIDALLLFKLGLCNSAYNNFSKNVSKGIKAAESVLNEHNTEIYIAMSPNAFWDGTFYHDTADFTNMKNNFAVLENLDAFGTFNKSNASITIHCKYDPKARTYTMDFDYYLMDFYDFPNGTMLWEANLLGICRSYELYGKVHGWSKWKDGQKYAIIIKS